MKTEEILKKAIEKAIKKGYNPYGLVNKKYLSIREGGLFYKKSPYSYYTSTESIIFSHKFAKAFWGEGKPQVEITLNGDYLHDSYNDGTALKEWQWQLIQMVLQEDPIKYLEKFL